MTLIEKIKRDVKKEHPEMCPNEKLIGKVKPNIFKADFRIILIIFILLVILVICYTVFIDFNLLKILEVDFEDNIKSFITGIITLVSMNLFVTNLLLTHLKEERDDIQFIIDKRVNFKFITYLGFTIILCILILYFISPTIKNNDIKSNILILIFLAFLFYIFQLVQLYNTVFDFIHKSRRIEIVKLELHLESERIFYNDYLKKEFRKRYQGIIVNNHKFEPFDYLSNYEYKLLPFKNEKDVYLVDIKIDKLERHLRKIADDDKKYLPLELDMKFKKQQSYNLFYFSKEHEAKMLKKLLIFFIFKNKPCLEGELKDEVLRRLLDKVGNNALNNKFEELRNNLVGIEDVYVKYINLK